MATRKITIFLHKTIFQKEGRQGRGGPFGRGTVIASLQVFGNWINAGQKRNASCLYTEELWGETRLSLKKLAYGMCDDRPKPPHSHSTKLYRAERLSESLLKTRAGEKKITFNWASLSKTQNTIKSSVMRGMTTRTTRASAEFDPLPKATRGNLSQTSPALCVFPTPSRPRCLDEVTTLWSSRQNNCHADVFFFFSERQKMARCFVGTVSFNVPMSSVWEMYVWFDLVLCSECIFERWKHSKACSHTHPHVLWNFC